MTPPPAAGRPRPAPASLRRVVRAVLCVLCVVLGVAICAPARSAPSPRWQWPIPAPHEVVEVFDAPDQPYGAGHRGIDIAVDGPGAEVRAVEAGTVRFAGAVAGRGVVSVLHADGLISTYEPVQASVQQGQEVDAGDVLGTIAPESATGSHCTEVLCLHLGARRGQEYLDPLLLLGERGPSVLLPWTDGDASDRTGSAVPDGLGTSAARTGPVHSGSSDPVPPVERPRTTASGHSRSRPGSGAPRPAVSSEPRPALLA